ncbi:hypothetical protein ABGB17_11195 [Sphaerisporangium sp. B11E5]|uniref:hypothetical protein n=1 Tax=Sphaerisporangium sp. B11E5 TaxID=3153563 RepID=UPI00325EBA5D
MTQEFRTPERLVHHHSHNDYLHRPLVDALELGYTSVEVDVWRTIEAPDLLQVGNRWGDVSPPDPRRTMQRLYLDPLRAHLRATGFEPYPHRPGTVLQLLIDVKAGVSGSNDDGDETERRRLYDQLEEVLADYADILTEYDRDGVSVQRAVNVVLTGERPGLGYILDRPKRHAAGDGVLSFLRVDDSDFRMPSSLVPLVSGRYDLNFRFQTGLERDEVAKLARIYELAEANGQRVRFWGGPSDRPTWQRLLAPLGDVSWNRPLPVLLNTDDLAGFRSFLYPDESSGR